MADKAKQYAGALRWVMSQPQGRLFIWTLADMCGESRTSFTGNSGTFFNEGQRNVWLRLKADILDHAGERFWEMVKENTVDPKQPKE